MKATGIVRRIDDLGRVVIPKEIRRTMRIREGDPLEIYTANDGEVIFKKYSPIGELSPWSAQYAEILSKNTGYPVLICDKDHVIAAAGVSRKEYVGRRISRMTEDILEQRKNYAAKNDGSEGFLPVEGLDRAAVSVDVVISSGDVMGAVVMLENDGKTLPGEAELRLASVCAGFLGKQMED
ncbi:MAG: AbrB/MazE/SpoVT family DNA-binding domain-containing protein [Clostridia bacterium]|nr:AbrB/MazE/SpoVT family DNA-binding domain-containing protein [Clostridia bacterium]